MQTNRIYYKMHPTFHYRLSLCELGCNAKFNEVEFQVNSYAQLTDTDNRVVKAWVEGAGEGRGEKGTYGIPSTTEIY